MLNCKYYPPDKPSFHSIQWMMETFNLDVKGKDIIHVGAHKALEAYIYFGLGARHVSWFECNPFVMKDLCENLQNYADHGYSSSIYNHAAWDEDDKELDFFFYNSKEDGTSSLLEPGTILHSIPETKYLGASIKVDTIKLDTLFNNTHCERFSRNLGMMNIDTQGSELHVLKGSMELLRRDSLKYIICEASYEELYSGSALIEDIDEFLEDFGFKRVFFRPDCIPTHGDAIYVR